MNSAPGSVERFGLSRARRLADRARTGPGGGESTEDWLVSYADLITLLFLFFALMLAASVMSKAKFERLSEQFAQTPSARSGGNLSKLQSQLESAIQSSRLQSSVTTQLTDEGLAIQFSEQALFGSAEAALNPAGEALMDQFAQLLVAAHRDFHIAVEGHTDDVPIHNPRFESNWSLSASRSVNVLQFLAAHGISDRKMMVRAYADTRPAAASTAPSDEARRAQSRRVTLLVF